MTSRSWFSMCSVPAIVAATLACVTIDRASAQEQTIEEVTVTGSRIVRRDFEANSPITTVDAERFEESSTIAIESVVNQLPHFVPAVTQFSGGGGTGSAEPAGATLSLRGLGANRNLVLLDGRRAMPMNAGMAVNIDTIPAAAIARVETITGGASSVYGADAIAGVVNFILKRDFEGVDVNAQWGNTLEGDGDESTFSVLMGSNFGDGQGNIMLGIEHSTRAEVMKKDRSFFTDGWADPMSDSGITQFHSAPGPVPQAWNPFSREAINQIFGPVSPTTGAPVAVNGAFYLNPDGTIYKTSPDGAFRYNGPTVTEEGYVFRKIRADGTASTRGGLAQNQPYDVLQSPLSRYSLFSRATLDITDHTRAFSQVLFSDATTTNIGQDCCLSGGWRSSAPHGEGIYAPSVDDNGNTRTPYLAGGRYGLNCPPVGGCTKTQAFPVSEELAILLDSRPDPEADWEFRISSTWDGPRRTYTSTTSYQFLAGLEGEFDGVRDWTWEAYASRGTTRIDQVLKGRTSLQRWRYVTSQPNYGRGMFVTGNELGAGFSAGSTQCTSGFMSFAQGEIGFPWDFGFDGTDRNVQPSRDCQMAVDAVSTTQSVMTQTIAEFNMQGGLVDMPAGELRFALGVSRRENTFRFEADTLNTSDSFLDLPAGFFPRNSSVGDTLSKEIYGELLVPVLADKPGARELNLELGFRSADNDPSQDVDSWKALVDWRITDRIRVRGGRQTANRAPNIAELYQSAEQQSFFSPRGDWCSDLNPQNALSPNPSLNPNAAQVRAICEARMGAAAADYYSNPDRSAEASQWRFSDLVGNPLVETESGRTMTLGVVADVTDALRLSLDYWRIEITDMIAAEHPDVVHANCFSPGTNPTFDPNLPACLKINRDPTTGNQANMQVLFTNEAAIDFAGYDFQVDWDGAVGPGELTVNFLATFTDKASTQIGPGAPFIEWKGTSGPTGLTGITPYAYDYRTFTTLSYNTGNWTATMRWRFLPSIASQAALTNVMSTDRPTDPYSIFDLAGRYSIGSRWQIRGGIDNVFDVDPQITFADADTSGLGSTNPNFYDILGRRFYVGASIRF